MSVALACDSGTCLGRSKAIECKFFVLYWWFVVHYVVVLLLFCYITALRMPTILVSWCIQHAEVERTASGRSLYQQSLIKSFVEGRGERPRSPIRRLEGAVEAEGAYSSVVAIKWRWLVRALAKLQLHKM